MFLQLESRLYFHFKMNVPFLLVLIYLLCLNPETSRTIVFFFNNISVRRFDLIFFFGKQSKFRTAASLWANRCICQYPRGSFFFTFLTSFYFFFFVYRLLKPPYSLKELLDRIVARPPLFSGSRVARNPVPITTISHPAIRVISHYDAVATCNLERLFCAF